MDEIERAANVVCGELLRVGQNQQAEAKAKATATITGLLKRLTDLGVEVAASFDASKYVNVKQDDLLEELRNMRQCRLEVWRDMKSSITARRLKAEKKRTIEEWSGWRGGGYNQDA